MSDKAQATPIENEKMSSTPIETGGTNAVPVEIDGTNATPIETGGTNAVPIEIDGTNATPIETVGASGTPIENDGVGATVIGEESVTPIDSDAYQANKFWDYFKEKWAYMWYTISHPMDGYYWIRHRERGSVPLAVAMVMLFSFSFSANRLLASFVVNELDPRTVNSFYELVAVLAFFLLICVSNWSVTCLMEGEGRFKDIVIAVGYGMVPMTIMMVVATIASWAVGDSEVVFYYLAIGLGIFYGAIMILIGIMQVHNYTLGKTLITLFLTFLAMLIIIFLILLLVNMLSLVAFFFQSIYTEIIFRA